MVARPAPRPYQERCLDEIERHRSAGRRRLLVVMPTGTGKTVVFAELLRRMLAEKGTGLVVAHREELLEQGAAKIESATGLSVGIEKADRYASPLYDRVACASVATIGRIGSPRLEWLEPAVVVLDEAHHAAASTWQAVMQRFKCYEATGPLTIGFTATNHRMDNKAIVGHGARPVFEEIAFEYSILEAIRDGWLCQVRGVRVHTKTSLVGIETTAGDFNQGQLAKKVDNEERNALAVKAWLENARGRKTIAFCASVAHGYDVARAFEAQGVRANCVFGEGDQPPAIRRAILEKFRNGDIDVLCNMQVLTEGFDAPDVSCILHLRPTQSWTLYTQMTGRGTRICEGKKDLLVIDVVDVTADHSLLGARKKGKPEAVSLPAMIGLPGSIDLQGRTLEEAAKKLDSLGTSAALVAQKQPRTLDDIDTILKQVDLFAAIDPDEAVVQVSHLDWLTMPDGALIVDCGSDPSAPGTYRQAKLSQDALGMWSFTRALHSVRTGVKVIERVRLGDDFADALAAADFAIRVQWPDSLRTADRTAVWRKQPPSPGQLAALSARGVGPDVLGQLTKGRATSMLSLLLGRERAS